MTLTGKTLAAILITSALFATLMFSFYSQHVGASTISEASDYTATTTASSAGYGATITTGRLIRGGTNGASGSFGTVVITGANTGIVNFYDATTTDITQRAPRFSTSTILLASLPASLVAGTYVFDAHYSNGLYIDLVSGTMPTTSILYR